MSSFGNIYSCLFVNSLFIGYLILNHGAVFTAKVKLASDTITIPTGHFGVLFFSAKTRILAGAPEDDDMVVKLGIKIDGVPVGSVGVQQLYTPYEASSRSLTASYLSAVGDHSSPLTAGQHTVEAYIIVETTGAKHPSVPEELTLTYFDFD